MTIEKIIKNEEVTLTVTGRLDTQTAPGLEKEVDGDTELFEKTSNINGFETFGQQIFLLLTS